MEKYKSKKKSTSADTVTCIKYTFVLQQFGSRLILLLSDGDHQRRRSASGMSVDVTQTKCEQSHFDRFTTLCTHRWIIVHPVYRPSSVSFSCRSWQDISDFQRVKVPQFISVFDIWHRPIQNAQGTRIHILRFRPFLTI